MVALVSASGCLAFPGVVALATVPGFFHRHVWLPGHSRAIAYFSLRERLLQPDRLCVGLLQPPRAVALAAECGYFGRVRLLFGSREMCSVALAYVRGCFSLHLQLL